MYKNKLKKHLYFGIFVYPLLLLYGIFFLIPMFQGFAYSFTDWNGLCNDIKFVGFENFTRIFNTKFIGSIKFTMLYTAIYSVLVNILALMLALFINMKIRTENQIRTILFSPYVLNVATIGFAWKFILGRLSFSLYDLTGIGLFNISWLSDKNYAMWAVILVKLWQSTGYFMVIYLAGLKGIPTTLLEASEVDGAVGFRRFFKITMPLMMHSFTVCAFLALVNGLRVFGLLMTLTGGGPGNSTESIALNIYREAFERGRYGMASSKALVFLVIILIITFIQLRFFKKREVEY